jgi:hypothetical protein
MAMNDEAVARICASIDGLAAAMLALVGSQQQLIAVLVTGEHELPADLEPDPGAAPVAAPAAPESLDG